MSMQVRSRAYKDLRAKVVFPLLSCLHRAKWDEPNAPAFFGSWYASHRIRRRLTLLEHLILRRLPIITRFSLFALSSLPRLHEEHNSHVQVACKGWKWAVFVLRTTPSLIAL